MPWRDAFIELLRKNGLMVRLKRRRHYKTTDSRHHYRKYPNLIANVVPSRPNEIWVSDIIYVETGEGKRHSQGWMAVQDGYSDTEWVQGHPWAHNRVLQYWASAYEYRYADPGSSAFAGGRTTTLLEKPLRYGIKWKNNATFGGAPELRRAAALEMEKIIFKPCCQPN